jgi:hypothetical protein
MFSLARMRELEPELKHASDEEVARIRAKIYEIAQLAYDSYTERRDSNFAVGSRDMDASEQLCMMTK